MRLRAFFTSSFIQQQILCMTKPIASAEELRALLATAPQATACQCALGPCEGWESLAEYRWEAGHMQLCGTLRDPAIDEPTLEEKHPAGTRYDDPAAPIALKFFPYNQCDIWHCQRCERHLLRYTEFGGYNVAPRIRALKPEAILDPE